MTTDLYPSRHAATPALLPRRDPVLHGGWREDAPLSREQAELFEAQGFLVLDDLFDEAEVTILQAETGRLLGDPASLDPETVISEPGSDELRSIFRIHAQSPVIARLAADARLAGLARFLLDDEVYLHQSRLNYKPGFEGKEFYWHSDFETWHTEDGMPRMRAISISIALSDNHAVNGPLMLIPKSHKHYVTCVGRTPDDHFKQSLRRQAVGTPDDGSLRRLVEQGGIDAPTGPAGSIVLFDCNTMHGSNGNITPYPRSNIFAVYNSVENALVQPFGGTRPRPDFIASRVVKQIT